MSNGKTINAMFNANTKALLSDVGSVLYLRHDEIIPNPLNWFPIKDIEIMKSSIEATGIAENLVAYENPNQRKEYILISGERRWTAAKELDLNEIPVFIIDAPTSTEEEETLIGLYNGGREEDLEHIIRNYARIWENMPLDSRPKGRMRDWIAQNLTREISGRHVDNYLAGRVGKKDTKVKQVKTLSDKIIKPLQSLNKVMKKEVDVYEEVFSDKSSEELRLSLDSIQDALYYLQSLEFYNKKVLEEQNALREIEDED